MKLSQKTKHLEGSSVLKLNQSAQDLRKAGIDIVSLAAGEPDFDTPKKIQDAAYEAIQKGYTKYSSAQGLLILRKKIIEKVYAPKGYTVDPDEVIIASGAKEAIYLALQCLIDPGDSVLIPTPMWVSYPPMVELAGGTIYPFPLKEEDHYTLTLESIKSLKNIPKKVKGIILNSPNNPTGAVYSKEAIKNLLAFAIKKNLWIISDEIYERIIFDKTKHTCLLEFGSEVKERCIIVSGFSKSYSMTGWRLGWAVAPKELTSQMAALKSQMNSNTPSFIQLAGVAALDLKPSLVEAFVTTFQERRGYCIQRLQKLSPFLSYTIPEGAFYFFINLTKWLKKKKITEEALCKTLLKEYALGVVPGSSFGRENHIRLSYAASLADLKKAFDRLESYFHK